MASRMGKGSKPANGAPFHLKHLKTVRVRRSRPSALSLALALMLTMLCVYLLSLSPSSEARDRQAAVQAPAEAEIHLPGLEAVFQCAGRYNQPLEAQLAAARCAQAGGAALVLQEGGDYAVVERAGGIGDESSFTRRADGLTLRARGLSGDVRAISDAALFLQALHGETAALADALDRGDTNSTSIEALMRVYRTQGERAQNALIAIETGSVTVGFLLDAVEDALLQLDCVMESPDASHLRQMHASACARWISLLETLSSVAENTQAPVV